MSYNIKQIIGGVEPVVVNHPNATKYMTPITEGVLYTIVKNIDGRDIEDSGVNIPGLLKKNVNYYLHVDIKKISSQQEFNVYILRNTEASHKQLIEKVIVPSGLDSEWASVEIVFTPAADCSSIVFDMVRNEADSEQPRIATIVYEELSIIHNLFTRNINAIKIGVQSIPGLLMSINEQPIRIGRSGIYELYNDALRITKFSVVAPAIPKIKRLYTETVCNFAEQKIRIIPTFVVDYMYEKED